MLIWGSTGKQVRLGEGQFHCPQCNIQQPFKHLRAARYFTLYFIPLFQIENRGEYIVCQACQQAYEPEVLNYRPPTPFDQWVEYLQSDLASGTPIEIAVGKLTNGGMDQATANSILQAAAGSARKQCPSCQATFIASISRCSSCGTSL